MLTFIKLGGSLITDKREAESFQTQVMAAAAAELYAAFDAGISMLIGHGSGSFGHVAAKRHGTMEGVNTPQQWVGFAEVAFIARRLNTLVLESLAEAGIPIFAVQPSASARCHDGQLQEMEITPITLALTEGLVPVVYGDVSFDSVRGGTIISTETIFTYLAQRLKPARMFLVGETEGVYDDQGDLIAHITPANYNQIAPMLGGSEGTDVTGGMATKVRAMLDLVEKIPGLMIRIFGGTHEGQIAGALVDELEPGTLISAE